METTTLDKEHIVWDLTVLYPAPDSPEIQKDMDRLEQLCDEFNKEFRGQVARLSGSDLANAFSKHGELEKLRSQLIMYAYLCFASNTSDHFFQSLLSKIEELSAKCAGVTVFFDLELGRIQSPPEDERLREWSYSMKKSRDRASHMLSEELEAYGMEKSLTGSVAFSGLFDELAGEFKFEETQNGETKTFSQETALATLHNPDREMRTRVYRRFLGKVGESKTVLTNIYNNIMLDHRLECARRGFSNVMESRCLDNQVSLEAVENMLAAAEKGYEIARKYYQLKAKVTGLSDFTNADIYSPIGGRVRNFNFNEARDIVLDAYTKFHPEAGSIVKKFFDDRRIDSALREGKRPGAFCYGATPDLDAFVHMNYTGEIRSVQTLAHELGHGLHHQLARRQNHLNISTPLTTAETASVFGEILVNELLIEKYSDPEEKLAVMASQMESSLATVFRQTVLTRFEQASHARRSQEKVAAETLCEIWLNENRKLFGDTIRMVDEYKWGWAYIPHFVHSPFYCYAYSFGQLLVLALYDEYHKKGNGFVDGYMELLSSGGSNRPEVLIKTCTGLDINGQEFWRNAIRILTENLNRIEVVLGKA